MTRIILPVQASNDRIPRAEMQLAYALQNAAWARGDKPARRVRRTRPWHTRYPTIRAAAKVRKPSPEPVAGQ